MTTPFTFGDTHALHSPDKTSIVFCPTDMHMVPTEETPKGLRTRAIRWKRPTQMNCRMVQSLQAPSHTEPKKPGMVFRACSDPLLVILERVKDQLEQSNDFVDQQLKHIEADQQRKVIQNQIQLSQLQIDESRKVIEQTETVRKPTVLAFVFIPASTICSFFGMNIQELDCHPRFWVFWLSLVIIVGTVIAIVTAGNLLNLLMRIFAAMPGPRRSDGYNKMSGRRWCATAIVFYAIHLPFMLLTKSIQGGTQGWGRFIAEGRAYRAGYKDPNLLDRSESPSEAIPTTPLAQQGAYTGYKLGNDIGD
jgi:hypothetical protein